MIKLYTGDDWVTGGTFTDTGITFATATEILVKVIINGRVATTLTKSGGDITGSVSPSEFKFTIDSATTATYRCGTLEFQISVTANGATITSTSDKLEILNPK
jgi:hypothetical protein